MKVYRIRGARGHENTYAQCSQRGTWKALKCAACGEYLGSELVEPVIFEWERGSVLLGDITDTGSHFLLNEKSKNFFSSQSCFIDFVVPNFLPSKYKKNVINYLDLPPLWWPRNNCGLHLDVVASDLSLSEGACAQCNDYKFKTNGLVFVAPEGIPLPRCFHAIEFGASRTWFFTEDFLSSAMTAGINNFWYEEVGVI